MKPDLDQLEIKHLRALDACVRTGRIAFAAEELGMTASNLSKVLTDLETTCGLQLLIRGKKSVLLTEHGRVLWPKVQELLNRRIALVEAVGQLHHEAPRALKIGFTPNAAFMGIHNEIRRFQDAFPAAKLEIANHYEPDILDHLDRGTYDLVYSHFHLGRPCRPRARSGWKLVVSNLHPLANRDGLTLKDLNGSKIFVTPAYGAPAILADLAESNDLNLEIDSTRPNGFDQLFMAASGNCMALVPGCYRTSSFPGTTYLDLHIPGLPMVELFVLWNDTGNHASLKGLVDIIEQTEVEAY